MIPFDDADIFNPRIAQNRCYTTKNIRSIINSQTIQTSDEFKKALMMMYTYDMTMYRSVDAFEPYRVLTRQEAAKILSNFAMNVLCRKPIGYTDIAGVNPSLRTYVAYAYQL